MKPYISCAFCNNLATAKYSGMIKVESGTEWVKNKPVCTDHMLEFMLEKHEIAKDMGMIETGKIEPL